ncbi:MAG TPA: hypothetical protein VJT09_04440 [Pyrinomonadaceae bacterium]|nr:hypothetical protein [Pyrinomonadaceae bacterium]
MNQRKDGQSPVNVADRMSSKTTGVQQPSKPGSAQQKATMTVQMKKQPSAPPVYRPQPAARVGQPKMALAAQSRNPPVVNSMRLQPDLKGQSATNPGARQSHPGETSIQLKSAIVSRPSSLSNRGGVIQRKCGECGSATHSKKNCNATAQQKAAYLSSRMSHGFHGKDRPKKHVKAAIAKSAEAVAATVGKKPSKG